MAILKKGPALSGKVGGLKYSQKDGVTVVSELPGFFHDAKTRKQLVQRMKLNNILLTYRRLKDGLKENFEEVSGTRRACHVFRGANLVLPNHAWIPSRGVDDTGVLAPMVVSSGTLQPIGYSYVNEMYCSDLNVGGLTISDRTRVCDLANAIVRNNAGWEYGDSLQVIVGEQSLRDAGLHEDSEPHLTGLRFLVFRIPMDRGCGDSLDKFVREQLWAAARNPLAVSGGLLCFSPIVAESRYAPTYYAGALVHTRNNKSGLRVSRQQLLLSDSTLFDHYSSPEMLAAQLGEA
ncbi:MAG: hypothetical protein MJZ86_01040 [Bacteroidales bacterium]|nr:hypothetical protein [Bacteroidales bacterium]